MNKRSLILMILSLIPASLVAQANNVDRLFTTSLERHELDLKRDEFYSEQGTKPIESLNVDDTVDVENEPKEILLQGVVQREDGKVALWINGEMILDTQLNELGIKVRKNDIDVSIKSAYGKKILKPGQIWYLKDNMLFEKYEQAKKYQSKVVPNQIETAQETGQSDEDENSETINNSTKALDTLKQAKQIERLLIPTVDVNNP